ncbi:4-hydroxy-tetrahydrodipicolinate synthase [Archaeoglobus fulgidus]|uniref:4-hydroxy-tetrahydrodipicolinate synthase n=2 Tax=Archaeoglobus fulgidus TaxID=2234 RepID=DAPA_ARCFU|nr:4-hydroxy-tetrahydrodipicolinate synthase [Archaeoglobus fulgidus]O29352.1 RecName: Full=4-hydroxy-tetrahydrodipicolinate synthase; Short=HTPA synthase [Archaeoglobus fulgidus DSM 4304]AAB90330.1 dihydrodipicolinate synthase (dapA) [Archaeoglobus fulgidus DSM 4304]AIG97781.1 dihydrodipicolinate synthase [Archaeoglobus fulgidus DSM 8774]
MFEGVIPAMVTPFKEDFSVDYEGIAKNLDYLEKHVNALVPAGTTGEAATLSYEEHIDVVRYVAETSKLPVIGGAGSNSTREAIWLAKEVEKAGAEAAMLVTPYYNKPNAEGLYQHYKAVASEVSIPIIVYNVPSRTGINTTPELVRRLAEIDNIFGIKEASGNLKQISEIIRTTPDDFVLLSGDDFLTLPILCLGGKGVISVAANVAPHLMKEMYEAFVEGNIERAREMHHRLTPLFDVLFIDTNPIPVKKALQLMGLAAGKPRLPLVELSEEKTQKVKEVLKSLELIS